MRRHKLLRHPPAVRWTWLAILAMASESPERGKLLVGDNIPATVEDIQDMADVPLREVRKAIKVFHELNMIDLVTSQTGQVFTVKNWEGYQFGSDVSTARTRAFKERARNGEGTAKERSQTVPGTPPETDTETEHTKGATAPVVEYSEAFLRFWSSYPRKLEKKQAFRCWCARLKEGNDPEALIEAAGRYALSVVGKEERYILHAATFLGPNDRFVPFLPGRGAPTPPEKVSPTR